MSVFDRLCQTNSRCSAKKVGLAFYFGTWLAPATPTTKAFSPSVYTTNCIFIGVIDWRMSLDTSPAAALLHGASEQDIHDVIDRDLQGRVRGLAESEKSAFLRTLASEGEELKLLPAELMERVSKAVSSRGGEMENKTRREVSTFGDKSLVDFDYDVRLVLGSDKLSGIRYPVCTLKLVLEGVGGESEVVDVELSTEELQTLLGTLDTVAATLDTLRTPDN